MEKTKVKQVIREALAREPAIEWYLKSKKIYGRYISLLADVILAHKRVLVWNESMCERTIKNIITGSSPLYIPMSFQYRERIRIISNHALNRDTILELYQN